ncbi:MAG: Mur ligase family protein [Thermomicrobiales bacterium]
MRLVEIRDLDGPNIFLLQPAIKVEFAISPGDLNASALADLSAHLEPLVPTDDERAEGDEALGEILQAACISLHQRAGVDFPELRWVPMETAGQWSLAFGWEHRRFAVALARALAAAVTGEAFDLAETEAHLRDLLTTAAADDRPGMVRDDERTIPVIAITGTNGKTTTTRLLAHILRGTGRKVGWTSTVGVFIEGECVLEGDYTGPAGAWRVLEEPGLDIAVLETARGGLLLRGMACESNDVSVMTNVTGDHLGLHGIHTVEGLAAVKSVVLHTTRPSGWTVLNADDPLVRGQAAGLPAAIIWVTQDPENPTVAAHLLTGGTAILADDGWLVIATGSERTHVLAFADVPITFGGRARHMIENVLCATGAAVALDIAPPDIARALATFGENEADNVGRLHVYSVQGATVILDYAHNEVGLTYLLQLAESYRGEGGRLISIIGTAGDRTDEALREIGRLAAQASDQVIVKETRRYLRGRPNVEAMTALYEEGLRAGGDPPHVVASDEPAALTIALEQLRAGDVVAMMCIESGPESRARLKALADA